MFARDMRYASTGFYHLIPPRNVLVSNWGVFYAPVRKQHAKRRGRQEDEAIAKSRLRADLELAKPRASQHLAARFLLPSPSTTAVYSAAKPPPPALSSRYSPAP